MKLLLAVAVAAAFRAPAAPRARARARPASSELAPVDAAAADAARALFRVLADARIRIDPSGGTCCRGMCSGCVWLNDDGSFRFETSARGGRDGEGYVAPYAAPPKPQFDLDDDDDIAPRSAWCTALFGDASSLASARTTRARRSATRSRASARAARACSARACSTSACSTRSGPCSPSPARRARRPATSPRVREAARARTRAPPAATPTTRSGGCRARRSRPRSRATAALEASGGPAATVDYEGMETPELKALLSERGMNCPLPMRRFIIEELRFFDANGRQGKRHPATKVLE